MCKKRAAREVVSCSEGGEAGENMLVIDRIEGAIAVCEEEGRVLRELPVSRIDGAFAEGDVLVSTAGGRFRADPEQTARRRAAILKKQRGLWADE